MSLRKRKDLLILSHLRQDARMKLTVMSRATRIPVSTLFDRILSFVGNGLVSKYTSLIDFERLGYNARALMVFSVDKRQKGELQKILETHPSMNSLQKINNGWDFIAEMVFRTINEAEECMEEIEEKVRLKDRKLFYILKDVKREGFCSTPNLFKLSGGVA